MSLCTVTGSINNILGQNAISGTVRFTLTNFGQGAVPVVSGTNLIVLVTTDVVVAANGTFTVNLQGNDTITPANTLYAVTYYAPNGAIGPIIYSIIGASFNLNSATPSQVTPPVLIGNQTANTVFSGPTSGGAAIPTFRPLVLADMPAGILAGSVTFGNVLAGTNTNALVIGTGGSLAVSGSGTISASSLISTTGIPATTGIFRFASSDTGCWRNATNSNDLCISKGVGGAADALNLGGFTQVAAGQFSSTALTLASGSFIRMASADSISWRNNNNSADLTLSKTTADELTWGTTSGAGFRPGSTIFANLGSPANGVVVYCSDCTLGNPCAGSGTGALAERLNGVWVCNGGGGATAGGSNTQVQFNDSSALNGDAQLTFTKGTGAVTIGTASTPAGAILALRTNAGGGQNASTISTSICTITNATTTPIAFGSSGDIGCGLVIVNRAVQTAAAGSGMLGFDGTTSTLAINSGAGSTAFTGAWNCTNVTPVTVNANVTTDQNLMACTIPAGTLNRVGRSIRIWAAGVYTTVAANLSTITLKANLCTVSGCGSGTVVPLVSITSGANAGGVTNNAFNLTLNSTTQTAGASSVYEAHGFMNIDIGATSLLASSDYNDPNTAVSSAINNTAQMFLQITGAFSIGSGSNSFTQRQMIVETIN